MDLKTLLKHLIIWRLLVLVAVIPAIFLIPIRPGFTGLIPGFTIPNLVVMWTSFDGIHYLNLAKYGYSSFYTGYLQAFFPVFPMLIKGLTSITSDYLLSGLLVSHLSLLGALWFLYKLVRLDSDDNVSRNVIFILLLFPTSFFFGSVYSESLFLLLAVSSFYFARKQNFLIACLIAAIASGTRVAGFFLLPALLVEFYVSHQMKISKMLKDKQLFWLLLPPIGLLLYMRYLYLTTGDPFFFANIQPLFGAQREVGRLILLYQVFFRYAKMMVFIDHTNPLFFTVLLEFITGTLFMVLTILAFKFSRLSYAFYMALSYILPTLTGTFSSMPRYVLVLFPGFILLSQWYTKQNKRTRSLFIALSIALSIISISLFTRGYFIG